MKVQRRSNNNLFYLIIFLIFFAVVIIASLTYRTIRSIQDSNFTSNVFNVVLISKQVYAIHFNRADKKVSYLLIRDLNPSKLKLDPLAYSVYLGLPIQAIIFDTKKQDIKDIESKYFNFSHVTNIAENPRYKKIGLNTDDLFKIYLTQKNTSPENKKLQIMSTQDFLPQRFTKTDDVLYDMFKELHVINNAVSIQVINATDINGLGNRVSRIFQNWGYDVVSVISEDHSSSQIVAHSESDMPAASAIQKVLNFPISNDNKTSIADISIIVADDVAQKLSPGSM